MKTQGEQEEIWRRFLLGDVEETERAGLEDRFLADEDVFVQIEIAEDELIEDYWRGDLDEKEKRLFETAFLQTAERRERVQIVRNLIDETISRKLAANLSLEKNSWRERLRAFFHFGNRAWQTATALAILILLIAVGAWFVLNRQKPIEVAETQPAGTPNVPATPQPSPQARIAVNANQTIEQPAKSPTKTPTANARKPEIQKAPQKPALAFLVLQPAGSVRGSGAQNRLRVSDETQEVGLRLNLETNEYPFYRARVTTVDGATAIDFPRLKSNKKSVLLRFSARKLKRGDYIVELAGITPAGQTESVNDYAFTLDK